MSTTATEETKSASAVPEIKPGVRHVLDNLKYPDYIRLHNVFHKQNKIMKVFPAIGLPNTSDECEYNCIADARSDATNLLYTDLRVALAGGLDTYNLPQAMRTLLNDVYQYVSANYMSMILQEEGRISLKFAADVGTHDGKPFIRKGEGAFKAYGKLSEKMKELTGKELKSLDSMVYFKNFSASNVPVGKKFKVVFASVGEEGLWDIATISMRGIQSCQTWQTPQSRGLIGSMSSKYVGVIYITTGEKFNEYGSKMLRRSLVRFCINIKTKKPGLLVDRIYPGHDAPTVEIFRTFLTKRTGLPVIFSGEPEWSNYQLPTDANAWKVAPFQTNEFTYMDTKIPWLQNAPKVKDTQPFYNAIASLDNNIMLAVHNRILKMLDAYCIDKKEHRDVFKGGVANLLVSLRKHVGGQFCTHQLTPRLYSYTTATTMFPKPDTYETVRDYERAIIRHAFIRMRDLEKGSHGKIAAMGKFSKFYPKSLDRYFAFFMAEYKKELTAAYKNLLT